MRFFRVCGIMADIMIPLKQAISSSIGKKLITSITGLALVGFVITHLAGNLLLIEPTGHAFNAYAYKLETFGALLWAAEIGLIVFFLVHIVNGFRLKKNHLDARPIGYRTYASKGGPTKQNLSSRSMIISGTVLMVFVVLHVWHFKFGPGIEAGYAIQLEGHEVRDLHRFVVEAFSSVWIVALYVGAVIFLGLHLKHGIWSGVQSLGALNSRTSPVVYTVGAILGVLLAIGFLFLPLYIHFRF